MPTTVCVWLVTTKKPDRVLTLLPVNVQFLDSRTCAQAQANLHTDDIVYCTVQQYSYSISTEGRWTCRLSKASATTSTPDSSPNNLHHEVIFAPAGAGIGMPGPGRLRQALHLRFPTAGRLIGFDDDGDHQPRDGSIDHCLTPRP